MNGFKGFDKDLKCRGFQYETGYYAHSATTGDSAHCATTGNYAHSATTGNYAHSATTGNYAESSVTGKNSIAAALGAKGKAKAPKGGWLVLAEYDKDGNVFAMGVAQVRGKKLKPDTFYTLKGGKFTEVIEAQPGPQGPTSITR